PGLAVGAAGDGQLVAGADHGLGGGVAKRLAFGRDGLTLHRGPGSGAADGGYVLVEQLLRRGQRRLGGRGGRAGAFRSATAGALCGGDRRQAEAAVGPGMALVAGVAVDLFAPVEGALVDG